jgi:hypothetical protein
MDAALFAMENMGIIDYMTHGTANGNQLPYDPELAKLLPFQCTLEKYCLSCNFSSSSRLYHVMALLRKKVIIRHIGLLLG